MASRVLSIRLSDSLRAELAEHARARGLDPSVAARDLIRRGLGVASPGESAMTEARIAARAELRRALGRALGPLDGE